MQRESEEQIRAFVALPVPDAVKKRLAEIQAALKKELPGAKWSRPAGLHITLKFLGEISRSRVERVAAALNDSVAGAPFELCFSGLGVFPNPGKARVLWLGSDKGAAECVDLSKIVEDAMDGVGFPREKRPFKAHLTLARFRSPSMVPQNVLDFKTDVPSCAVERVVLYRSILKPAGAEYTELHSVLLK